MPENVLADVYDGEVWKQFQHVDGQPFLASPWNCVHVKCRLVPAVQA